MKVVADTDIISTFARIKRLDILKKLFDDVVITNSVKQELVKGKIDVRSLNLSLLRLTREELKELRKVHPALDKGERECFVIARNRNLPLASNEKIVSLLCEKEGMGYFTLPRILRFAILEGVITRQDATNIVELVEREENTKIKNKKELFK
jgi:predicted nucleic acid-binding protein